MIGKKKHRGTQDELELLRLIIDEDANLREKVLDRVRQIRVASKRTILDSAAETMEQKSEVERNAKKRR